MTYTLQIVLQHWKPANERTIRINTTATFVDLAQAICSLYGLDGEHLWEFVQKHTLCINHPEISIDTPLETAIFDDDPDLNDPKLLEESDNTLQVSATNYTLEQYFTTNESIVFSYDFLAGWLFTIKKTAEDKESISGTDRTVISGTGTYLLEDSGGPDELKAQIHMYQKKKFDEDVRETFEDFAERIQPALTTFENTQ